MTEQLRGLRYSSNDLSATNGVDLDHKKSENRFEYVEVSNKSGRAKIVPQRAHLFHHKQVGKKPFLWLIEASFFEQELLFV